MTEYEPNRAEEITAGHFPTNTAEGLVEIFKPRDQHRGQEVPHLGQSHIEKDGLGRARPIDQGPTFGPTDIQPVSNNEKLTELEQAFEDLNGEENVARSG